MRAAAVLRSTISTQRYLDFRIKFSCFYCVYYNNVLTRCFPDLLIFKVDAFLRVHHAYIISN